MNIKYGMIRPRGGENMIRERNIVTNILLSIFTCGIYSIVWFITLTDDAGIASEDSSMSGGMAFLLTIVTCGIYGIYWNYKMGKAIYAAKEKHNLSGSDNSILYLILGIFGLGIVNYCLMQSDLNDIAKSQNA